MGDNEKLITTREPMLVNRVRMRCPCGGEVKASGMTLTCMPPIYVHACDKCNERYDLRDTYPSIVYEATNAT